MEKLSIRRSILGTGNESDECTRSNQGISSRTSRCTLTSSNHGKNEGWYSTKGTEEIIQVAGWEIWARWLGATGKGMGKVERKGLCYGVGRRQWWRVCVLQTVRTPTLCIPDTSDRPGYFLISLSNLAMPLITYGAPCITLLCSTFIATLLHIWCRPYPYLRISFIH